jgi:hypothetical protein
MIYHILNGDALAENFNIEGEKIICREAFIEGELSGNTEELWLKRADFFKQNYQAEDYFEKVKTEFDKLEKVSEKDEVNLWFGNEVFCQINMWFCLYLLQNSEAKIYRVFPNSNDWNCKFDDLEKSFANRVEFEEKDLQIGRGLWSSLAWQKINYFEKLSKTKSECFVKLDEVCQAIIEKDSKPKELLLEIVGKGESDFSAIFSQFQAKASVYGFGDSQVKNFLI